MTADAFAGDQAAELGQCIHRGAGGDDKRSLLVRHLVGNGDQRIDIVDLVFAETAIGGEPVGAMALVDVAVIEAVVVAGGVHALAATLALAAAGVDFDRHARADLVFVDARSERHHRAHVFMAGREVLVERQAALNRGRRAVIDDLEIGGADRDCVDAHQHFRLLRHRHRLLPDAELARIAEHPGVHAVGNRKFVVVGLHARRCVHFSSKSNQGRLKARDQLAAACGRSALVCELGSPNSADSPRVARTISSPHELDVLVARAHRRRRCADRADHGAGLIADGGADADHAGQNILRDRWRRHCGGRRAATSSSAGKSVMVFSV